MKELCRLQTMMLQLQVLKRIERAINEFQPFKAPGPDGIILRFCKQAGIVLNVYTTSFSIHVVCQKQTFLFQNTAKQTAMK